MSRSRSRSRSPSGKARSRSRSSSLQKPGDASFQSLGDASFEAIGDASFGPGDDATTEGPSSDDLVIASPDSPSRTYSSTLSVRSASSRRRNGGGTTGLVTRSLRPLARTAAPARTRSDTMRQLRAAIVRLAVSQPVAGVGVLPEFVRPAGDVLGIGEDDKLITVYLKQRVPRDIAYILADYVRDSIPLTRALRVKRREYEADPAIDTNGEDYETLRDNALALQSWLTYDAPPLARDTVVWRGTRTRRDVKPYYYSAISGWSLSATAALSFAGATCCLFRMTLPRGTHAFATQTNEYEILIGKHQFRALGAAPFSRPKGNMVFGSPFGSESPSTIMVYDLELIV